MITYKSTVNLSAGDTRATLLVSKSIFLNGTIKLDQFHDVKENYGYVIHNKNGYLYYYFPLGTSLFSVPVVAVVNLLGYDHLMSKSASFLQRVISSFVLVGIFLTFVGIALLFLSPLKSIFTSLLFVLGSAITSTLGIALWSHNYAILFSSISILIVLSAWRSKISLNNKYSFLMGALLFSAYLCRPTFFVISVLVFIFVFLFDKAAALKIISAFCFLMIGFVTFCLIEFSQILPDYYLEDRFNYKNFPEAFVGNLISPSRGIIFFSPIFFIPLLFISKLCRFFKTNSVLLILISWPFLHLVFVSFFDHWWGGWSFGPRLLVDAYPGLFLLFAISFTWFDGIGFIKKSFICLLVLFSIYVNTYQGLYNVYTLRWNDSPEIDYNKHLVWDWKYPQFLYSEKLYKERMQEYNVIEE